jgi:hypothetical protein
MPDPEYIYESPDGGDTVYRRVPRSNQRELVRQGPIRQKVLRAQLWRKIMLAAESDPDLEHMLEQTEIYYQIKHAKG